VAAAVLAIAAFDFWFVPPYGTFSVADARYGLTFVVMLVTGLVMGGLTARIRWQAEAARDRERRTAALLALSRELAAGGDTGALAAATARHVGAALGGEAAVALTGPAGELVWPATGLLADEKERSVARWVSERGQSAGTGSDTLPGARGRYLPLATAGGSVGVVGVSPTNPHRLRDPEALRLLEVMADQAALALERARLAEGTQRARLEVEAERLRTSLLSALSHDLRTPLGAIEGAGSSLLTDPVVRDDPRRNALTDTIVGESRRMTHLVANLLDMVRLESGALNVQKEWVPLEEVIGVARIRTEDRLQGRPVTTRLPVELLLVPVDALLLEQVFINLLENASRYTPPGTPVDITASRVDGDALVEVADRGPGLPPGGEAAIFEKFERGGAASGGGIGLGLTICRGILRAHGGRIWAENRVGGGAAFRFTLPLGEGPPPAPIEPDEPGGEAA
jgi:two-component system sensor histidine kinase KdpD